eukprot:GGOE01046129.1.p1 GENE.GGOE01046129.1~~GGOE01046129.1.p1  ORF type:complete len:205 (-),score=14.91 GGOE01046129.1:9-623(-)
MQAHSVHAPCIVVFTTRVWVGICERQHNPAPAKWMAAEAHCVSVPTVCGSWPTSLRLLQPPSVICCIPRHATILSLLHPPPLLHSLSTVVQLLASFHKNTGILGDLSMSVHRQRSVVFTANPVAPVLPPVRPLHRATNPSPGPHVAVGEEKGCRSLGYAKWTEIMMDEIHGGQHLFIQCCLPPHTWKGQCAPVAFAQHLDRLVH